MVLESVPGTDVLIEVVLAMTARGVGVCCRILKCHALRPSVLEEKPFRRDRSASGTTRSAGTVHNTATYIIADHQEHVPIN